MMGWKQCQGLHVSLLTQAIWPSFLSRELKRLFCNPAGKCHRGIQPEDTEHVERECFRNTNYQDKIKKQISNNQINRRLSCVGFFGNRDRALMMEATDENTVENTLWRVSKIQTMEKQKDNLI